MHRRPFCPGSQRVCWKNWHQWPAGHMPGGRTDCKRSSQSVSADNCRLGAPASTQACSSCWNLIEDTNGLWMASWKGSSWQVRVTEVPVRGGKDAYYLSFSSEEEKGPCGGLADVPVLSLYICSLSLPSLPPLTSCNKEHSGKMRLNHLVLPSKHYVNFHPFPQLPLKVHKYFPFVTDKKANRRGAGFSIVASDLCSPMHELLRAWFSGACNTCHF